MDLVQINSLSTVFNELQRIPLKFSEWITKEITNGGLLEEIDQYCQTFRTEGSVQSYEIWVKKEDWRIEETTFTKGGVMPRLNTPSQLQL